LRPLFVLPFDLRTFDLRALDARLLAALMLFRSLPLFYLPLGGLSHRVLRALGPFTFRLLHFARGPCLFTLLARLVVRPLPALLKRSVTLLGNFPLTQRLALLFGLTLLLALANLSVTIRSHSLGNRVAIEYR
jgi:hypothetical protein